MKLIKTNDPDFCKDEVSGAVINTNVNAYKLYKKQRNSQEQVLTLNKKVDSLYQELSEMKLLLEKLVKDKNGNINI